MSVSISKPPCSDPVFIPLMMTGRIPESLQCLYVAILVDAFVIFLLIRLSSAASKNQGRRLSYSPILFSNSFKHLLFIVIREMQMKTIIEYTIYPLE